MNASVPIVQMCDMLNGSEEICVGDEGNSSRFCMTCEDLMSYYEYPTSHLNPIKERILLFVFWGTTFLTGVLGNSLVVYVVFRHGPMKTVSNLYFANLAVADLLFLLFCIPYTVITHVLPSWPFGEHICRMTQYFMMVSNAACVMTLVAMGVDRYRAVVNPMVSRSTRTVLRTLMLLVVIWIMALVSSVPFIFLARLIPGALPENVSCGYYFAYPLLRKAIHLTIVAVNYVIPLSIIALCYCMTLVKLYGQTKLMGAGRAAENSRARKHKVTRIMLVVVATFAVCWLPIYAKTLHDDFSEALFDPKLQSIQYVIYIISQCMCYANSALNPIIYSFMSSSFRQSFREAFCCLSEKTQGGTANRLMHTPSASPIPAKNIVQRYQTSSKEILAAQV